jgi:hypothetical protein
VFPIALRADQPRIDPGCRGIIRGGCRVLCRSSFLRSARRRLRRSAIDGMSRGDFMSKISLAEKRSWRFSHRARRRPEWSQFAWRWQL